MENTAESATFQDPQVRLVKIETNVGWLNRIGAGIGLLMIAAIGWLNVQSADQGERLASVETILINIEDAIERNTAAIERNAAVLERIEARLVE
ncbi:MAG: hypothetical protein OXE85_00220 [Roseovarius sp.]|nr:hypothetical protein [Roseovarius sp.]